VISDIFLQMNPILITVLACIAVMLSLAGLYGLSWLIDSAISRLIGIRGAIIYYVLLLFFVPSVFISSLAFFVKLGDLGYLYSAVVSFAVLLAILVRAFNFFSQRSIVFMATEDDKPIIFFTPKSARRAVRHTGHLVDAVKNLPEVQGIAAHVNVASWIVRMFSRSRSSNRQIGPQEAQVLIGPAHSDDSASDIVEDH
jgi:hypothetical protein